MVEVPSQISAVCSLSTSTGCRLIADPGMQSHGSVSPLYPPARTRWRGTTKHWVYMKKFGLALVALMTTTLMAGFIGAGPASAAPASQPTSQVRAVTAPAAKKLTAAQVARIRSRAVALSKPSAWRGLEMVHPKGKTFPTSVKRWANLVSVIMAEHKIPQQYLVGILAQIQQESWGDPNSINKWDSNFKRGTPSMGLLQMIAPTYLQYAKDGLKSVKFQALPYANVWAALKYVKSRYGMSKFAKWNRGLNQGY